MFCQLNSQRDRSNYRYFCGRDSSRLTANIVDAQSTEFCTAIRSIIDRPLPIDAGPIDDFDSNGTTFDWNEPVQEFNTRAYEEKDVTVEVVQPSTTKTRVHKLLRKAKTQQYCVFCRNNDEPESVYRSHPTRDIFNRIVCSRLRAYICPICHESGDNAHTIKYCPKKPILTMDDIGARNSRKRQ